MDVGLGGEHGLDVVLVRLPAEFLVEYDTQNASRIASVDCIYW